MADQPKPRPSVIEQAIEQFCKGDPFVRAILERIAIQYVERWMKEKRQWKPQQC